ncbi:Aste57867_11502 [Aphanomyces stellatus]|uniref:Aste57867_11502 protein n=1 Tax=Aphanomyces stellatus TaxID=120398 RepID=A0A485KTJ7_9STRA|nr:hypothetical protein As57867_011459 [Aphanomyces stellatus]VFT88363.1 Aste57867_11502 [Aphanomyces stellatus]
MSIFDFDANMYMEGLQALLTKQTLHDIVVDGLKSPMLYAMFWGYVVGGFPVFVLNVHKANVLVHLPTSFAIVFSLAVFAFSWLFLLDSVGQQVFYVLGASVGAFCTHLHFEIIELIRGHVQATSSKDKDD